VINCHKSLHTIYGITLHPALMFGKKS
jgi:hypothetical protein